MSTLLFHYWYSSIYTHSESYTGAIWQHTAILWYYHIVWVCVCIRYLCTYTITVECFYPVLFNVYMCSITDITTVSPPGLLRSALTVLNSRESYINLTWTPSPSQQGAHIFCYTATDNFGCVTLIFCMHTFILIIVVYIIIENTKLSFVLIPAFTLHCRQMLGWVLHTILHSVAAIICYFIQLYNNYTVYAFSPSRLSSEQRCITLLVGGKLHEWIVCLLSLQLYNTPLYEFSYICSGCSSDDQCLTNKHWESVIGVWPASA